MFKKEATNWMLPGLYTVIRDLKSYATKVFFVYVKNLTIKKSDNVLRKSGKKPKNLALVMESLMPLFRSCISDRSQQLSTSKMMGSLQIANYCFASYFEVAQYLNSC